MNKTTFLESIGATLPALKTGRPDDRCWDFFTKNGNVVMLTAGNHITKEGVCELSWMECNNFRQKLRIDHLAKARIPFGIKEDYYVLIRADEWENNNEVPFHVNRESVVYKIKPSTYEVRDNKGYATLDLESPVSILEV